MLYDSRLNVAGEIPLEGELCTALGAENGRLYLFIDKNMEIYEEKDGRLQNTGTRKLRHQVTQCHITDLDGDGVKEYILTDGMDLYVYHAVKTASVSFGVRMWAWKLLWPAYERRRMGTACRKFMPAIPRLPRFDIS